MPPRRALLDDDEDLPMPAAGPAAHDNLYDAAAAAGPIALDFGAPPETLFQQLVRHWLNERHAPDLLPVQAEVLSALLDHIRRQVRIFFSPRRRAIFFFKTSLLSFSQTDTVQALRGDPDSSEAEHARIMLVQTEVERVKFVVRSYIRTRLYKERFFLPLSLLSVLFDVCHALADRKVCTVHRCFARGARETVPDGTGPCETARVSAPSKSCC